MELFHNRIEAGRVLAKHLDTFRGTPNLIVLALPRGGVSVAAEVAKALDAPLDVMVVRKLGVPGFEELAMGAVASDGARVFDEGIADMYGISEQDRVAVEARERQELERREALYRAGLPPLDLAGKVVVLVDDGLATGATMEAAARATRAHGPQRIVVAVPVAASDSLAKLRPLVDHIITVATPEPFFGVGLFYDDFAQISDDEVLELLRAPRGGQVMEEAGVDAMAKASFDTLSRRAAARSPYWEANS
jgi:predicted phosphoribosyltransferase